MGTRNRSAASSPHSTSLLIWPMLVLLHIVLVLELCDLHGGLKYLEISYFKGQPTNLW